ncbi:MAG: DUF5815 family protein [Halobacteriaceae archaeon]
MAEPRVPGSGTATLDLPCGETIDPVRDVDMGMRELTCDCGATHAVVMDVHPPSRFVPESIVDVLREAVETRDAERRGEFGTPHLMAMATEEFPEDVVLAEVETGEVGYSAVWVTAFDSRRLHEVLVELLVEMMDHAVGHSPDDDAKSAFASQLQEFDVAAFVEAYRDRRDFTDETDAAL